MNELIADENCLFCNKVLPNYIPKYSKDIYVYYTECKDCNLTYNIIRNFYNFYNHYSKYKALYFAIKNIVKDYDVIIKINFKKDNDIIKFEVQIDENDESIISFNTFDEANKYYHKYISNLVFQ